jgi:hypothetical protein
LESQAGVCSVGGKSPIAALSTVSSVQFRFVTINSGRKMIRVNAASAIIEAAELELRRPVL